MTSGPGGDPAVCYVSSEHCYQKPGASWEKAEEGEKEKLTAAVKLEVDAEQKVKAAAGETSCR